ncbi:hypothetical protein GQ55_6G022400 [Panicum hallii var. hallii]|uniref:Kelch repeat-containing protein n=1 Tax=Panicum hallii var. hallii TaxID=1504633 RepID=A0A2T7D2Z4_9POAL|nr:hypothetical protein GQ55_6G022400 [Panicum hallii var. hallii]PUZ49977.1 hypothetical protein GQ55_6G022400 [Panicum hallii var. hallii]PUZ49978.1 hypothetical protein GQ55_6G022400 [Panicum hallii var. hallii]
MAASRPLPLRLAVPLALALLLALALVADFLRASSSSRRISALSSSAGTAKGKRTKAVERAVGHLNATYADLPAPRWDWEEMPAAPVPRLDGAAVQIGDLLYVFAGYGSLDHVHSYVDVYNFTSNTWTERFHMPKEMAHSHLGMVSDGRYVYTVSGQYGPQCRASINRNFVLDTETKEWRELPPLPLPRYAPATQLWRGRLHVMGGGKEDRHEPGLEHWSLAVKDGEALENEWRAEVPIPRGGPHRACVVANDKLFVIGGQEGDFMAKPGSPIFKCVRRHEVVYGDVYMLDDGSKWKQVSPMPKPDSHIEFAWVVVNNSIVIVGGTTEKHPITKKIILVGEVFRFDLETMVHSYVDVYNFTSNTWTERFHMPKEMAHSHLGMVSDGRYVYTVSGQYGPQCRASINRNFVLDTETKEWRELPPLPLPRYAPATQLWRGRLHVMGGGKEDRHEPGLEHWSLAVKDGEALENEWRAEVPIPRGGPHRACVVANDKLFVIGGQEGDFMAKPGSPIFKCVRRHEVVYGDVYMLDDGSKWKQVSPMPKPDSHIEFAWVVVNNSIVIVGGTTEKHPITKKIILVGEVFRFDLETMAWSVIGRMPFRIKTALAGYWQGWLYFTSGQRDRGPDNPGPKKVVGSMWRTRLHL